MFTIKAYTPEQVAEMHQLSNYDEDLARAEQEDFKYVTAIHKELDKVREEAMKEGV